MRTRNILLAAGLLALGAWSCTPEFDVPPVKEYTYNGKATMTIQEFKAKYTNTDPVQITDDVVLHAVINSSDSSGNIYKKIYFQDLEGTAGLELSVDATSNFLTYNVGQEVYIECKGMYVGKYGKVTQLGTPYIGSKGTPQIGRMPMFYAYQHIHKQGTSSKSKVKITTINSLSELTADMLDRVITIKNVYFPDGGNVVFANSPTTGQTYPTSRDIADEKGGKAIVYTSGYANFAQDKLPKGLGTITCIASQYNGTWQLLIRDRNDIGTFDGSTIDPNKPIIVTSLNETFSAGSENGTAAINGWSGYSVVGDRNWIIKTFSGNNYAQATAYNGTAADYEYWLVSPGLNLDEATQKLFSFETAQSFWSSTSSLEVYIMSTNNVNTAQKELITPRIALESDTANSWIQSGSVDLSAKSGIVYIGFRYRAKGGSSSTTYRIDNFKFGSEVAK